jgi:uncharacterized membrane protein
MMQDNAIRSTGPLTMDAPWRWLQRGWADLAAAPALSVGYGLAIVGGGAVIILTLQRNGMAAAIPFALGLFALVAPLLALPLYEMSRRREAHEPVGLFPVRFAEKGAAIQVAYMGFLVAFGALVWALVGILLFAIFTASHRAPLQDFAAFLIGTPRGLAMATIGTVLGGAIAFAIYAATVVSIPMLMNERSDVFSGVAAGVRAIRKRPGPMLLWAWLIGVFVAAGVATFFVGLAVVFPLLGHATWAAYRDIRASV